MRRVVNTSSAPQAMGPYSQAVVANGLIFVAGQTPLDPQSQKLLSGGIAEQTERALKNVSAILDAAGASLDNVVRCVVYLRSMDDFATMNAVFARYFTSKPPARTTIAVADLPRGALIEIEVTALATQISS